ncbi:MAG: hypothetical protein JW900_09635 [Anaerolineae bacterium]|nr:hypothetical protein [Anaerolineae bacterium]
MNGLAAAPDCSYVPLHASAVAVQGGAWIFLGPGGTGKSTMLQLIGRRARPLADDKIYLVRRSQRWIVVDAGGRDFHYSLSDQETAALDGPHLQAVVQLRQASELSLEPLVPLDVCRGLVEAFFELPWHKQYDVQTAQRVFSTLAAVARAVPGYRLHATRSPRVYPLLDAAINIW